MAQGTKIKKSLQQVQNTEERQRKQKRDIKNALKKANHILGWLVGIVMGLLPVGISYMEIFLHHGNDGVIELYKEFNEDFMNSGSFLWISITLLSASFVDLLLYGFRKKLSYSMQVGCRIIVIIAGIIEVLAMIIYFENIASPINSSRITLVSWVAFVVFAAASGFLSFKIVQEG